MTDAELRIIAFLMTSDATRPADLPDWLLSLLEHDRREEPSHELITAAALMYVRRLHPGISFDAARSLIAQYAADPARLAELSDRIAAFRLSCCFERLKRSGRFEEVLIDDPFDPDGIVAAKLTEAGWRSVNPESHEPNSVTQPVPLTPPSTTFRSNAQSPRPLATVPATTVPLYNSST